MQRLLQIVQPLQIRLKEWYTSMRETLRMDNDTALKLSSTGMCEAFSNIVRSFH